MKTLLLLSLFLLTGCGLLFPPSWNPPTGYPPTTPPTYNPPPNTPPTTQGSKWGVVKCLNSQNEQQFNIKLREFLSTTKDPSNFAQHSCSQSRQGGVFFQGSIAPEGGSFRYGANNNITNFHPSSFIEFHFEALSNSIGSRLQPIKLPLDFGAIQGQTATLHFQDDKGAIRLHGSIVTKSNKLLFEGIVEFENFQTWTGKRPGYDGRLGAFSISACQFLRCN